MRISVLVLEGVFDTGLAMVLDTFALANALGGAKPAFTVSRVGVRRRVKTGHGLTVALDRTPTRAPDLVVVPALGAKSPAALDAALEQPDVIDAAATLQAWSAAGTRVAAACTATFLLASTGLLDERHATTTWWLAPAFRERFPAVALDEAKMLVDAGPVVTAGAALAHLDLAIWIVRRHNAMLARTVAHHLTFDRRLPQAAFVMPEHIAQTDPLVERFEAWARRHLDGFTIGAAARALGASERTLERRVHRAVGKSPLSFVQDLRVECATVQLETTDRSVDEIAAEVGYRDGVTLRNLLRARTGRGVRDLRGTR